ncbi:hypothetical protein ACFL1S_01305 [Pseudomonadota bacterium]
MTDRTTIFNFRVPRRSFVWTGNPIHRMQDLKGKKTGLSKRLNTIKNDWWRFNEHMGIEMHAPQHRHDHGGCGDRGVPLPGRLA